jgi:hypothetical protein
VGLKDPQAELPQVTVHVTPAFLLSLVTTVVRLLVVPMVIDAGAAGLKATEMGGAAMVMVAVPDFVLSELEVAVTVTVFGVVGAV